ncbi:MAG: PrsW family intramembrane metalloprotease [Nocardioidaceae bacterium]|nr:PrsW family intramembrane metalloprotease [Nocardioidaceae bacterium]
MTSPPAAEIQPAAPPGVVLAIRSVARRRWPTFTVALLLVAVGVACGWVVYDELADAIDGLPLLYAVLFAFVPVLPLSALFVWLNRLRPEPTWLLLVALGWGALAATAISLKLNAWLAVQVGDVNGASPRSAVFVAPWVEEVAKGAVIFAIVIWRRHDFNAVVAGVVFGGLAGIGFAFTENVLYYGQHFQSQGEELFSFEAFQSLFLWRGIKSPFAHPMLTMMTGAGIGIAVRHRHVGVRILAPVAGFCAAALLHMGYNSVASFAATSSSLTALYLAVLLPTLFALVTLVALVRRHERHVIAARLRDYTAYGWLKADQLPYIVSGAGRRAARRHSKQFGKAERDRVRAFQRTGMDLGLLRDRIVRGVAGATELPKERDLIAAMRSHRGRVLLPGAIGRAQELPTANSSW